MPSQWDARADRDLLLTIIDEGALKSVLWPKIAKKMHDRGYTFSHEACRQHFQKIRKEAKSPKTATPETPTPRKRSANASSFKSNKSSTDNTSTSFSDDDDENFDDTPSKKQRMKKEVKEEVPYQPAYRFKAEEIGAVVDLERDDLYEV